MKKSFHGILMKIGASSGCHQMPSRSFFWHGWQFPVCARCTGLFGGYLAGTLIWIYYRIPIEICIVFVAILFSDWAIQYINLLESNNIRRLITGILCGIGYLQMLFHFVVWIWNTIDKFF